MDAVTTRTVVAYPVFPMSISRPGRVRWVCWTVLAVALFACSDMGAGMVAIELQVNASTSTGEPLSGGAVWLEDHEMPIDDRNREHLVCETDKNGRCCGQVGYRYAVRLPQGFSGKTARNQQGRFRIRVVLPGEEVSTALPQLTSEQLHGLEPIQLNITVPAVPPREDSRR